MNEEIKIFVADDHQIFRQGLLKLLESLSAENDEYEKKRSKRNIKR